MFKERAALLFLASMASLWVGLATETKRLALESGCLAVLPG
jgi:hypothetical protein